MPPTIRNLISEDLLEHYGAVFIYRRVGLDRWGNRWQWTRMVDGAETTEGFYVRVEER